VPLAHKVMGTPTLHYEVRVQEEGGEGGGEAGNEKASGTDL
jgi:hypothetical protein